ncbi:MAG TPA: class I SAM-dependent methyltransferase [Candidatus Pacearchaeota archaeon]|nr:class I SAM-dependent methyltransferase [Candidatus Pacearchaeota archaeon]
MWESPIYKVTAEIKGGNKDILIDVTGSAPNFSEPHKQLEGTFEVLLQGLDPKKTKILDFGAAKLRNTLYLLDKGYTVYACEFNDLFKRSQQAKDFYDACKGYRNFKTLIFPDDFIGFDKKFDVVLLINVLNIMPVPIERLCALALCRQKMKEGGRLLWYTQHGTYSEANTVGTIYDGFVTGKGREYHMFYRDFSRKQIHDMLASTGFLFNKNFKFPMSGGNQAYLFNAVGEVLIDKTLGLTSLLRKNRVTTLKKIERKTRWEIRDDEKKSKKVIYEAKIPTRKTKLKEVNILKQYSVELKKIKPGGGKKASKYHQLIFNILKIVFENKLKNPKKEFETARGSQRIDIRFTNNHENGFFRRLLEHGLICPNIFFECKNYSDDLKNPEFFQMRCRLNKVRGQFGIIVCRDIKNHLRIERAQNEARKKDEFFLVLEDKDIQKLIKWKLEEKEEEIDNFLDNKFNKELA